MFYLIIKLWDIAIIWHICRDSKNLGKMSRGHPISSLNINFNFANIVQLIQKVSVTDTSNC